MRILTIVVLFISLLACKNDTGEANPQILEKEREVQEDPTAINPYRDYGVAMLLGKFDPVTHNDYIEIDTSHADRPGLYLHKDTYEAFNQMYQAAKKEGVHLQIRSATRNFEIQKSIWEAKWNGERKVGGEDISKTIPNSAERALKILEYSSMPSTSRHHWGSDIDLNNFNNEWFEHGVGKKIWDWLEANASNYGFCRPYTAKGEERPNGYFEERWHWSYTPLANHFMNLAKKVYNDELISGFDGAETAVEIGVVEKYIFGINKECLNI